MADGRGRGGQPGNTNGLVHGGAAALKAVQRGEPMTGLAAMRRMEVSARLDSEGAAALLRECAIDFVTVAELYRAAVYAAHDAGDTDRLTAMVKTWGWINAHAARVLGELAKAERASSGVSASQVLEAMNHDTDG